MTSLIFVFDSACDLLMCHNRIVAETTTQKSNNSNNNYYDENARVEFGKLSRNSHDLHETARLLLPFLAARRNLKLAAKNGLEIITGGGRGRERIALVAADIRGCGGGDRGTVVAVVKGKSGQWAARYAKVVTELVGMTVGKDLDKLKGEGRAVLSAMLDALDKCPEELWLASALPSVDNISRNSSTLTKIVKDVIAGLPSNNLSVYCFSKCGKFLLAKSDDKVAAAVDVEQAWMLGVHAANGYDDYDNSEISVVHMRSRGTTMPALVKRVALIDGRVLVCLKTLPAADADTLRHLDKLEHSSKQLLEALESYCIPYSNKVLSDLCRRFWDDCKAFNASCAEQKLPLRSVQEAVLSHFKSTGDAKPALLKFLRDLTRDLAVLYGATTRALERTSQVLAEFTAKVQESVERHRFSSETDTLMSVCAKNAYNIATAMTVGKSILTWAHVDYSNGTLQQKYQDVQIIWESIKEARFSRVTSLESRGGTLVGLRCVLSHCDSKVFLDAISWFEDGEGGLVRPPDDRHKMRMCDHVKSVICGPVTLFNDCGDARLEGGAENEKCSDLALHLLICLSMSKDNSLLSE